MRDLFKNQMVVPTLGFQKFRWGGGGIKSWESTKLSQEDPEAAERGDTCNPTTWGLWQGIQNPRSSLAT